MVALLKGAPADLFLHRHPLKGHQTHLCSLCLPGKPPKGAPPWVLDSLARYELPTGGSWQGWLSRRWPLRCPWSPLRSHSGLSALALLTNPVSQAMTHSCMVNPVEP